MARLRHLGRHAHQSIVEVVRERLEDGGWFAANADDRPFSTAPMTFREVDFETATDIEANTVSIVVPGEDSDVEHELGGGVLRRPFVVWIDVYATSPGVSAALAEDIKESLALKTIPVLDFTSTIPAATSAYISVESVVVDRPPSSYGAMDFKRNWRTMTIDAELYFEAS